MAPATKNKTENRLTCYRLVENTEEGHVLGTMSDAAIPVYNERDREVPRPAGKTRLTEI